MSTALVLLLLAASAVAFAVTEGAKLSLSPIAGTDVTKVFSPAGRTVPVAHVAFRLRTRERLDAWIENGRGETVRTLLAGRTYKKGAHLDLIWDGFTTAARLAPDGTYQPVVKLERTHRTIKLPNPIVLDTKPPVVTIRHPLHAILSPDADGHGDAFHVPFAVNEAAHGILRVLPVGAQHAHQVEFTRFARKSGSLVWNGKLDGAPVRPGRFVLYVAAEDVAGNRSTPVPFALIQVRYVVLARRRIVARPGARFAIRVSTDAPTVEWRLHGRAGRLPRGTLHLRAPRSAGVYHLFVTAAGHAARATVVVA
jgi:hypothetical protein